MKKDRLLNPQIVAEIAALGHTEYICIGDCGLPIPKGVKTIDVSIVAGLPKLMEVLKAIADELVIESTIVATEVYDVNPAFVDEIKEIVGKKPIANISHEEFKKILGQAKCVVRTGETSPYANVILVGGVNF